MFFRRNKKRYRCYLYFIQAVSGGPVKIGIADDPQTRLRQLTTGSDEELRILKTFGFTSRKKTFERETYLHRRFSYCNLRLEWFEMSPGLLFYMFTHGVFPRFKLSDFVDIMTYAWKGY